MFVEWSHSYNFIQKIQFNVQGKQLQKALKKKQRTRERQHIWWSHVII